jgi:hypothetical protein
VARLVPGLIKFVHSVSDALGETATGGRKHHAVPLAIEERNAELLLEQLDLPRQSRLHGVQDVCRTSHAARFSDRQQGAQFA